MKMKYTAALAAFALCGTMNAQDIYKVEALSGSDLNGTARYVGMGGAMSALGADLSVMGSNPAGIGMYRRSDIAFTGSATVQPNGQAFADIDKARGSFDQAGFVYAINMGNNGNKLRFVNFGFNYQKRRNMKSFIGLNNISTDNGASQTWQFQELAGTLDLSQKDIQTNPSAITAYDAKLISPKTDVSGRITGYDPSNSLAYNYNRAQWGGIQQYDFNVSFNISNRVYIGATVGVYNVDMRNHLEYDENLVDNTGATAAYNMDYDESLTGTGFDIKAGVIFRPLENSPFRIGLSVSTPIFYDLTQNAYLKMNSPYAYTDNNGNTFERTIADYSVNDFDYRIRTPWKLGISLATTVGNYLALDAEYEVSRYTGAQVRYPDYHYDDWYDYGYTSSTRDRYMDKEIDNMLNTLQTFRMGAEVRFAPGFFGRIGYNYVSSPFKKEAYLNTFTESPSYAYSLNTDYVNLGAINRITLGMGYRGKHVYADMAYQYQNQQADVYAFRATADGTGKGNNILPAQQFDLDRHNVMFTLGFKF
uniref:hypothetical protein n=1 Tax=Alloprevotella sp. TaxID=1872471 RepID=UPI00402A548E